MSPQVTVYTRPGCAGCQLAREYLARHGVAYEERGITRDEAAARDLERINAPGVPVVVVDGDAVLGFDKIRLDDRLEAGGVSIGEPV